MIPIPLSIKNLRLTSSLSSNLLSDRTGTSFSNTTKWKYGKPVKPVQRRNGKSIPEDTVCPLCGAPHHYIYDNNGGNGQYQCKICGQTFSSGEVVTTPFRLTCPHCGNTLVAKKDREFTVDFFAMDLNSLPKNASSLKFSKHNAHVMSLCLTLHINLGLSLRKTSQALKDLYNVSISHQQIANYCKTAAICIKPFVDNYDYKPGKVFTADETYIKVKGIKAYVWFIMDAASRSIIGYQVSDNRSVGPCILAMRMAFRHFKELPKNFKFIADGYSAYPLAAMEFAKKFRDNFSFLE